MANIGPWDGPFAEIPLSPTGESQANALANSWTWTPDRIIISPYTRTRQTAAPTLARFPGVPVEYWDIHEFTYWDPAHWNGSTPQEMGEDVQRYWRVGDAHFRQGNAETFAEMLARVELTLTRLQQFPAGQHILLFTHGHFIQALRQRLRFPTWSVADRMLAFREFDESDKVKNIQTVETIFEHEKWQLV